MKLENDYLKLNSPKPYDSYIINDLNNPEKSKLDKHDFFRVQALGSFTVRQAFSVADFNRDPLYAPMPLGYADDEPTPIGDAVKADIEAADEFARNSLAS